MSETPFPLKDLSRRKLATFLTIFGLAICVASTVFLILLGDSIGLRIELITGNGLAFGFSFVFSRFTVFASILNVLSGILVVFFLFSLSMSERVSDIGIMKAFGCLASSVFSIFTAELFLMVFLGCITGTAIGLIAYLGVSSIIGLFSTDINWWLIFGVFLSFFSLAHLLGARSIAKAIQMKPADALSPSRLFSTTTEFSGESLSKLGFTLKVAFRSLMRRALPTRNLFLCLTAIFGLVTVSVVGGLVANETTENYLERAVGRDVVLIAHRDLVERYAHLLSQFQETKPVEPIDYLDNQFTISEQLIQQFANSSSVAEIEKRLIFETTVYEGYGVVFDPFNPSIYYFVGEGRFGKTFVMGIDSERVLNGWFIEGNQLPIDALDYALIGNLLADKMFVRPLDQEIVVFDKNYKIAGICLDPFNNGNVTYVPYNSLPPSLKEFGHNLLLLRVSPEKQSEFLTEVEGLLSESDFEFLELSSVLEENLLFLGSMWFLVMLLPLSSLLAAVFCLFTYLTFSMALQRPELGVMRAIGAKAKTVTRIVVAQILIILSASTISGASIGLTFVYVFLIPEPVISTWTLSLFASLTLTIIVCFTLFSLYFTAKIIRKPISKVLHPF